MKKEQLEQKTNEVLGLAFESVHHKIKKAIDSGAINIEVYEDNYLLSKIIICAVLSNVSNMYKPIKKKDITEVNNLKKFL
jgi:hypothetical protein